jgi:hypothetical protein
MARAERFRNVPRAAVAQDSPGSTAELTIGVLGPLYIQCHGAPVEAGPCLVLRLPAVLALEPPRTVPREETVDLLWECDPPRTCVNLIPVYISRLRSQLRAAGQDRPVPHGLIRRDRGGYRPLSTPRPWLSPSSIIY